MFVCTAFLYKLNFLHHTLFVFLCAFSPAFTDFPKGWYLPSTIWITIQGYFEGDATNALYILDAAVLCPEYFRIL